MREAEAVLPNNQTAAGHGRSTDGPAITRQSRRKSYSFLLFRHIRHSLVAISRTNGYVSNISNTTINGNKSEDNSGLNQVSNVHGHLCDVRIIKLLDIFQHAVISLRHEVNRHSLPTEPTATTNPMNVVLPITRQVIVDHQ